MAIPASPKEIVRFLDGRGPDWIVIAVLSSELQRIIGSSTPNVLIQKKYADKIIIEKKLHRDHLSLIPTTVDFGAAGVDRSDNKITFFFREERKYQRDFKLVIKKTRSGHENWVLTFHRVDPIDVKRVRDRWNLLKEQAGY